MKILYVINNKQFLDNPQNNSEQQYAEFDFIYVLVALRIHLLN